MNETNKQRKLRLPSPFSSPSPSLSLSPSPLSSPSPSPSTLSSPPPSTSHHHHYHRANFVVQLAEKERREDVKDIDALEASVNRVMEASSTVDGVCMRCEKRKSDAGALHQQVLQMPSPSPSPSPSPLSYLLPSTITIAISIAITICLSRYLRRCRRRKLCSRECNICKGHCIIRHRVCR